MDIKDLKQYKEKLSKFNELDQIKRDVYLSKLAKGELQGPSLDLPSINKQWLKFFDEEAIMHLSDVLKDSIAEGFNKALEEHGDFDAIIYMNQKIRLSEVIQKGDLLAENLVKNGVKPGDIVSVSLPCVPEFVYYLYAINKIGEDRGKLSFGIDGAVVKVDDYKIRNELGETIKHPRWAMAYKFEAEEKTTILKNVDFYFYLY